ncbi:MAG: branched-chain amino acid aminotransferase [Gammaproteobacteria bacterium]|nr:branched-chain amino acid aminotransferase [Gammaproteobacteria bacterium]MDH3535714.1 branched-chain amino acid aminotransferase [Gammaproteobacteria bacterium]
MQLSDFPVTHVEHSRLSQVNFDQLGFGTIFSDHMFSMDFEDGAWRNPRIHPYQALALEPGVSMLHYGQTVFDGYKAFRGLDGDARVFRPDMNARRLHNSCQRLCIPIMEIDELHEIMINATRELIRLDHEWMPSGWGQSLYIRPLIIGTESTLEVRAASSYRFMIMTAPVGSYFGDLQNGVSLRVEDRFTRAASIGGLGEAKTAANYAASLLPGAESRARGFDQVLWLDGNEHRYIEEVGAMNIFFKIDGKVVTPPLGGSILPGVVRDSALTLLEDWGLPVEERRIAIDEVIAAFATGALEEVFGAGTAAVICPVASIGYRDEVLHVAATPPGELTRRLYDELTGIQYGKLEDRHGWNLRVPIPD